MINYYVFDKIVKDDLGCYWGHKDYDFCEVYPLSSEDTEDELIEAGYAKCDAPGTETFVVLENDWSSLR
jgi:hypothetical protein